MDAQKLKNAGIDYDNGVKRFVGRANLYEKVLAKFPKDGTFNRIKSDYESKDYETMLNDAHELKGVCGNIALSRLYTTLDELVKLLRTNGYSLSELDDLYNRFQNDYNAVVEAIRSCMGVT